MMILENVLSRQLKPLCSRDNHVMKYELGSTANTGHLLICPHCENSRSVDGDSIDIRTRLRTRENEAVHQDHVRNFLA
jgi:hypothetical protein